MTTVTVGVVGCPVCKIADVEVTISRDGPRPYVYSVEEVDPADCECYESPLIDRSQYHAALIENVA